MNRSKFDSRPSLPGFGLFGFFFGLIFLIVMTGFVVSGYLGYKCYSSNDPNSMACYMMSNRHEIGVRQR